MFSPYWVETSWVEQSPQWVEEIASAVTAQQITGGGTSWQVQQRALNKKIMMDDDMVIFSVIKSLLFLQGSI